jgi:hypothetical protein
MAPRTDGLVQWQASVLVPQHGGLALVGDAAEAVECALRRRQRRAAAVATLAPDGDDGHILVLAHDALDALLHRAEDLQRVVLHPVLPAHARTHATRR